MDGREVQLTQEQMELLKVLTGEKVGEEVASRRLSQAALGIDDPVQALLHKKMAGLAKKMNYPYGDKLIISKKAGTASTYKLQGVEVSFKEAEIQPERETDEIKAQIATIQRLAEGGILINPDLLKRAQEAASAAGGAIKLLEPPVAGAEPENHVLHLKEETFAALYLIMHGSPDLTAETIIEKMGESNGRKYTRVKTVNSMFTLSKTLAEIIRRDLATEWHLQLWQQIKEYTGQVSENDPYVIRTALKAKVTAWFKERI